MKQTFLLSVVLLCCISSLQAQKIQFESSLEKAKSMARDQQKPIAIFVTFQTPKPDPSFMKGLNDEMVVNAFNTHFINYKVDRDDTAASKKVIRDYKVYRFPSIVFIDAKGGLLFSDVAILSRAKALLDLAEKALGATKETSLADYDSAYRAGNVSTSFLRDYILRRRNAGIINNADLVEKYVSGLQVSALNNYAEVLFILQAGPVIDGLAYKLAYSNKSITDSIFKTEPAATRLAMNNAMINNSMSKAIARRDHAKAVAVSNFTRNSWPQDRVEGQKMGQLKMLQYYLAVKDTANYLQNASFYYDHYYMRMSVDSVRKKDSIAIENAKNKARENAPIVSTGTGTKRTFSFSFPKDAYATELSNAAWNVYKLAGENTDYLLKAMMWSKRSIEYAPHAAFYNTYAHLLYKLKLFDEAERMQKNAIETGKAENRDTDHFEAEYRKMKSRTL
jgi:hypothetical protein